MSSAPAPHSSGPSSPGSTRQLLDELDALMQRMLELPVNQLEDDPAPPMNTVLVSPSALGPPAAPAESPGPAELPSPPESAAAPARQVITHAPTVYPGLRRHRDEAPAEKQPEPAARALPAPVGATTSTTARPTTSTPLLQGGDPRAAVQASVVCAPPAAPELSWRQRAAGWVMPGLLWGNRAFDRLTGWLGNPGRWLRSPAGRATLGWVGLGLWTVALILGLLHLLG
jgi:hypothetical protein